MALTAKKVYAILKRQISDMEAKLNSPVRYRGTVATADLLPLNPDIGDMYNIESKSVYGEAGMNVAWNGVVWDTMGAPIDMSLYFTKEEAEAVIQRLVTEYFEKNPVKPGATTEQAQQIEQNKKDVALLKEDISTKITKFYASSQGETHLADSDNGKIMDMMVYGKSEQKQYSGKNLLELSDNQVQSENLKIQINQGIITFSGAVNSNAFIREIDSCTVPSDGTYTISTNSNSNKDSPRILFSINDNPRYESAFNGVTKELNAGDVVRLYIRISSAGSYDGTTIKPMIEKGSEVTSYEPYVGGQPSPSPDYPQEIKSVVKPTVKVTNEDGLKVQSVTLNNITLNAIPVSSGGNVTINGQQYIADYVDVEREKLVKKLKSFTISDIEAISTWGVNANADNITGFYFYMSTNGLPKSNNDVMTSTILRYVDNTWGGKNVGCAMSSDSYDNYAILSVPTNMLEDISSDENACASLVKICENTNAIFFYSMASPIETDLTPEEIEAFKELVTYYPVTNISVNSEQLDGYTVFNYPISMKNGWDYVKKQLNDNRDYIYNMDTKTQDIDTQAAEAYVNSEYAVALTELEV